MKPHLLSLLAGAALLSAGCTTQPSADVSPTAARPTTAPSAVAMAPSMAPASGVPVVPPPPGGVHGINVPIGTASASAGPPEKFLTFTAPDGSFSIGAPVPLLPKPDASAPTAVMFVGEGGVGNRTWEVGHQPIPEQLSKSRKPNEIALMALSAQTFTERPNSNMGTLGGHPAFLAKAQREDGAVVAAGVAIVGDQVWAVRVITPKQSAGKADLRSVNRFFDSLKLRE